MGDKKIVVLGGGTTGWLTALFYRKLFPSHEITVLENTAIKTIGVGEATTPLFVDFLQRKLNIYLPDMLKATGGSIKNGISFENWNGDNKKYFHGFMEKGDLNTCNECLDDYLRTLIRDNLDMNDYVYGAKLSYENKVDDTNLWVAIHMDTEKLGKYLKNIALQRNIVWVDGNFNHVQVDENDFITALCLEDGSELECDFVFDCSGFARLLIGKYYKVNWVSYADFLPMDKAVVFSVEKDNDIKPYTQAIAMKYGWMWKIPLQDRTSVGYVFDSNYLDAEAAVHEAQQILNQNITNVRTIPFEAGRYETSWVNNCMAVGLASSFVEPLESTSIHSTVSQLFKLGVFVNKVRSDVECSDFLFVPRQAEHMLSQTKTILYRKLYAHWLTYELDDIASFIYFHYLTKRCDTDFWINFQQTYKPPTNFESRLQLIYENRLTSDSLRKDAILTLPESLLAILDNLGEEIAWESHVQFPINSYFKIGQGLDIFKHPIKTEGLASVEEYKQLVDTYVGNAETHKFYLGKT